MLHVSFRVRCLVIPDLGKNIQFCVKKCLNYLKSDQIICKIAMSSLSMLLYMGEICHIKEALVK